MTRCLLITGRDHGQPYLAHEFERIPDKLSQLRHWLPIAANADGVLAANSASSN